jgi:ribonucleoside-diphosphate reductase alpha chain
VARTRDALSVQQGQSRKGLQVRRLFTTEDAHPYDELTWQRRDAVITNWRDGSTAFEQRDLEFPSTWSQNATNIVAQKYFRGPLGTPQREHSVRQMVDRVAGTITEWGAKDGYFASQADGEAFRAELTHLLVNQRAAFNSPVWFNVGVEPHPQCSACQPHDALISTPTGMVPIGELVDRQAVGTVVYDAHGETRVRAVKFNGSKRVYRVRLRNGSFIEATGDHVVFAASKRRSEGVWLRVDQLQPGMRLHLYPHRASSDDVVSRLAQTIDPLELRREVGGGVATPTRTQTSTREAAEAALAGWLQADGFVGQYQTGTNTSLTIEFMTVTEEEHDWVQRQLQVVFPGVHQHVRTFETADQGMVGRRIRLYGDVLRPFVEAWDLLARRHDLRVPARLWTAPNEVVAAYLRSVFQADGYVTAQGGSSRVAIAVISEAWTEDLQVLLLRLGIYSRRLRRSEALVDRSDLHEVQINMRSERAAFAERIGFVSEDKATRLAASLDLDGKSCPDLREEEILAIEDRSVQPVYDIQTDSGEYLSNNVRVHNCFILSVEDTMPSILNWYVEEGLIFKGGSGAGINLSTIRSSKEPLGNGGEASGPVSFMRGADASAGTIKCLHQDTEIVTAGGLRRIAEVEPGTRVLTRHGLKRVLAVHDNGVRPLVKVRTALGDEILCTPEHRFRVRGTDGETWREARQLRSDDHLVIDLANTGYGSPQPLTPVGPGHHNERAHELPAVLDEAFALWLGWIYGDGSITTRRSANFIAVQLGDQDPELPARYTALVRTLFGSRAHIFTARHSDKADGSASVRFCSTQVIRFLEANGLRKAKASELRVPALVKSSPPGVRAAFLSGVFEADGHVGNGYPTLSTISAGFARDVHRLLLSIGIPSKIGVIEDRVAAHGRDPVHTVRVVGCEGVRRFAKLVGLVSERKSRALEAAVTRKDQSPYETAWVLPHVGAELDGIWRTSGSTLKRALAPYARYTTPRSLSLLRAQALLDRYPEELAASSLVRFALGHELHVPVTVEPAGEGPTFDLTVEDVHEYLVHNVVTHNSGGKTRRAAKMVVLNVDHPDVRDFIWCKAREEHKARVLRDSGFDMDLDGRDSISIQYQNANNSVRVTDDFLHAYEDDGEFDLKAVLDGHTVERTRARDLMREIAQAAWECADPGIQYDSTINDWHTTPESGRINASNPCSEYMHLDNSACNLASLNLLKFLRPDGAFDVEAFKHGVEVVFLAQEIIVGNSSYPTDKITKNAKDYRQLGLGYANLGALLMAQGQPYDSDGGRAWAAAITALMTGHAYRTSARIAQVLGPFAGYAKNRDSMLRVMGKHRTAVDAIDASLVQPSLLEAARMAWDETLQFGAEDGFRNAQASVIAPTGCLTPDTLVTTNRGLLRLGELGDPQGAQWQDLAVTVSTDEGPHRATKFFINGEAPTRRIVTKSGYTIQGTLRHRIKVVDPDTGAWKWRRLADIRSDDVVPLQLGTVIGEPRRVPLPVLDEAYWTGERRIHAPDRVSADLAELVGYFMGDGSLHAKGLRFCVADTDLDVVERLRILGKELFGIEAAVSQKAGYQEVALHSVRVARWWQASGFAKHLPGEAHTGKGWEPHIPSAILEANDREVYGAFMRGLFEADGSVTAGVPSISTASEAFAGELRSLLLTLGIPTTTRVTSSGWGAKPISQVRIRNLEFVPGFTAAIGFISARKARACVEATSVQSGNRGRIHLPREVWDELVPVGHRRRSSVQLALRRHGGVTRKLAAEIGDESGDPRLLAALGYVFERVAANEDGGVQPTYDLSVPDNVTYVASGFISHNTIGLMMDCDTTGIEPDLALVKTKKLVGGGSMSIVNQTVPRALSRLGYADEHVQAILEYIADHNSVKGAPALRGEHYPVFDCAMGDSPIHYMGHIRMMAAVQPFISGALSKTVNMPESVSVEEVEKAYHEGWKLGLKALAIYRDNCKVGQPLSVTKPSKATAAADTEGDRRVVADTGAVLEVNNAPVRRRLPRTRPSKTTSFRVGDIEGYLTAGSYPDDGLGEIFVKVSKQGSTLSGVMDAFAIAVSMGLQYGVPLEVYVAKFSNMIFEPNGITDDPDIRITQSLVDYIARRLAIDYLDAESRQALGIKTTAERIEEVNGAGRSAASQTGPELSTDAATPADASAAAATEGRSAEGRRPGQVGEGRPSTEVDDTPTVVPASARSELAFTPGMAAVDAPFCSTCGVRMRPAGSCFVCESCGTTSGCS